MGRARPDSVFHPTTVAIASLIAMTFDYTTCTLSERDADGFVRCQPQPYGSKGALPSYETFQPFGLYGRPKAPTNGVGCNLFLFQHGEDWRTIPGHDPRWVGLLPDFGDGGAPLYATTELSGAKKTPYLAFFGEGGAAAEGTFRLSVPSAAGTTTIEIEPSAGDITITHPGGTTITVSATTVEIGGAGAVAIARAPELQTWAAQVDAFIATTTTAAAAGALGAPITLPPVTPLSPSVAATKGTVL